MQHSFVLRKYFYTPAVAEAGFWYIQKRKPGDSLLSKRIAWFASMALIVLRSLAD
jgi:hypothetical protein